MHSSHNRSSLHEEVMAGAKNGAAIGKCMSGIVGTAAGGVTGAAVGCLHWLIAKPLANLNLLEKLASFAQEK